MRTLAITAVALSIFGSQGCTIRQADLTAISTRSVNLDRVDLDSLPRKGRVEGRTSKWMILGIPLGIPHLEDAVDDALTEGQGDLLTDAVVYQSGWSVIFFGQSTISVEGEVVSTRDRQGGGL